MVPAEKFKERIDDLEARLEARRADLRDLATMGAVVTSIHEINAVLSVAMDMALRLVNGEVGSILFEESGELRDKISWGVREEFVKSLEYREGADLASYCFNNREAVVISDADLTHSNEINIKSAMALPIQTAQKCFGVMMVFNKVDGTNFTNEDKEVLEMLLNFVAVAIDNSLLVRDKLKRQKIEQEMLIAKQVQETILPQDIDSIHGADIGAVYFPARDVGGDFYDVIKIDDTKFVVVLGDVSNKGVPAALIMSAAAGIIMSAINAQPDISVSELAAKTNDMLASGIIKDREMFVTLFFCKFDLARRDLTFCNAGHVPGLFWEHAGQKFVELAEGGPIVGQFPGISYRSGRRTIESGDKLLLFTDGLTEAADRNGQLFGRERVRQVFATQMELSPKEFCMSVKHSVDRFAEGCSEENVDDFTVVQVKVD